MSSKFQFWSPFLGYIFAVTMAAVALAFAPILKIGGIEWILPDRPELVAMIMIYWIGAFFGSGMPVVFVYAIAKWFRIDHVLYYLFCGALVGSMLSPLAFDWCVFPADRMCLRGDPKVDFWDQWWERVMPFVAASGAFGGLTFWWAIGRHVRHPR